ncbi:MerR family transcriptional regulator [Bacillus kexueae]|uniref:MerR family transcriptional regulator n=1 Tax=Aeribacillus kexueae TaxID=2078952 RepID=UPI001FAE8222|nr:MerR family transcriptional regulator [Bacillus kexueae]
MYTISELAKALQISPHTLRYYEKEGIMESIRTDSGERRYTEEHDKWLRFVLKLRETQMPIAQIKKYAMLVKEGEHTTEERLELLKSHLNNIQKQLIELQSTEEMLQKKVAMYEQWLDQHPRFAGENE